MTNDETVQNNTTEQMDLIATNDNLELTNSNLSSKIPDMETADLDSMSDNDDEPLCNLKLAKQLQDEDDVKDSYPRFKNHHMDDLMDSVDTEEETIRLLREVRSRAPSRVHPARAPSPATLAPPRASRVTVIRLMQHCSMK
ncbi:hypothetical protein ACJJTC_013237 [Scirpophaga incertulas]